jgi:hypothetical protein
MLNNKIETILGKENKIVLMIRVFCIEIKSTRSSNGNAKVYFAPSLDRFRETRTKSVEVLRDKSLDIRTLPPLM